ncbi:MAG: type II secretion system protein [Pirellulales bacterium]|nr:type II secretion system protein [Pirellulales bacterium]
MKRRAFTLIEMTAVIAVSSALLGVGVVMLIALVKSEGSSRRHLELSKNLSRLDDQFRADAHAAASADVNAAGDAVEFALPAPRKTLIRYRCLPREIAREEVEGEKTLRRESYSLPEEVKSTLEKHSEGAITLVIVRVEPKSTVGSKIRYPATRIEAVLAKDLRFGQLEKEK